MSDDGSNDSGDSSSTASLPVATDLTVGSIDYESLDYESVSLGGLAASLEPRKEVPEDFHVSLRASVVVSR